MSLEFAFNEYICTKTSSLLVRHSWAVAAAGFKKYGGTCVVQLNVGGKQGLCFHDFTAAACIRSRHIVRFSRQNASLGGSM